MTDVFCPLTINGYYQCGAKPDDMELFTMEKLPVRADTPIFRNIYISNITSRNTVASAGYLLGIPESPIENVSFDNIVVEMKETEEEVKEKPVMAYHIRATKGEGFFVSNGKDIRFNNVWIKTVTGPAFTVEDSEKITINGLTSKDMSEGQPGVSFNNVKDIHVDKQ
jgi:hypothetical protein